MPLRLQAALSGRVAWAARPRAPSSGPLHAQTASSRHPHSMGTLPAPSQTLRCRFNAACWTVYVLEAVAPARLYSGTPLAFPRSSQPRKSDFAAFLFRTSHGTLAPPPSQNAARSSHYGDSGTSGSGAASLPLTSGFDSIMGSDGSE